MSLAYLQQMALCVIRTGQKMTNFKFLASFSTPVRQFFLQNFQFVPSDTQGFFNDNQSASHAIFAATLMTFLYIFAKI